MNNTSLTRPAHQGSVGGEQEQGVTMVKTALRWSGVALVASAILLGTAMAQAALHLPGGVPMPLGSLLLLVGSMLLMLALPGMYACHAETAGGLGLVGHVLL